MPFWPTLDACLNGFSAVCLLSGLAAIKAGRRELHALCMRSAALASLAFLGCYLYYHFAVLPAVGHTPFNAEAPWRQGYYALLISHVVLAVVNLPMVLRTLWLAHRQDWERHKRLARWTFPLWLYVSVTGVLVYLALYVWNPPPAAS
jgi:uncharacterized membrane protein YozB (DUF420 family)